MFIRRTCAIYPQEMLSESDARLNAEPCWRGTWKITFRRWTRVTNRASKSYWANLFTYYIALGSH